MNLGQHLPWIMMIAVMVFNIQSWWHSIKDKRKNFPERESGYRFLYKRYMFWSTLPGILMGVGIISGKVENAWEFLHSSNENTFVSFYFLFLIIALLVFLHWIWARDGAKFLEKHPGSYFIKAAWSASKIRWWCLGLVAWNLFFLIFFYVSESPGKTMSDFMENT